MLPGPIILPRSGATISVDVPEHELVLSNVVASLPSDTSTASRVKLADLTVVDLEDPPHDPANNVLSVSGADASHFEVFDGDLYLKAGELLNPFNQSSYSISVDVTDTTFGLRTSEPYSLTVTSGVTPDTNTYDGSSGTETVPHYDMLVVELWGPGAGGAGLDDASLLGTQVDSTTPSASTISTLSMTANGGTKTTTPGGGTPAGGTASGGNTTNTQGGSGHAGAIAAPGEVTSGHGGSSPSGGAQTAGKSSVGLANGTGLNGGNGAAPGAGGSGAVYRNVAGTVTQGAQGGAGGGYSKSVYVRGVTAGAPAVGASLSWAVGAGTVGGNGSKVDGGTGANGRARFAYT